MKPPFVFSLILSGGMIIEFVSNLVFVPKLKQDKVRGNIFVTGVSLEEGEGVEDKFTTFLMLNQNIMESPPTVR